jgi:Na+/H+-translocating membrane pyrophosphatase
MLNNKESKFAIDDALGTMSTFAIGLAIDVYSPTNDNAGGIAQMAGMSLHIREKTNALYAAGNITATIGKELTIGSVTLVSWAFLVFVSAMHLFQQLMN